jgi:hypothetical protein
LGLRLILSRRDEIAFDGRVELGDGRVGWVAERFLE